MPCGGIRGTQGAQARGLGGPCLRCLVACPRVVLGALPILQILILNLTLVLKVTGGMLLVLQFRDSEQYGARTGRRGKFEGDTKDIRQKVQSGSICFKHR